MKIKKLGALLVSAVLCAGMAAPAFAFEGEATPVEQPMLYNTGTRQGLVRELRLMQCYLMPDETALRELSEQVIEKLNRLTDAEFAGLEFPMN